jgi:hypothetical protein
VAVLEINSPLVEFHLSFIAVVDGEAAPLKIAELVQKIYSLKKFVIVGKEFKRSIASILKSAVSFDSALEIFGITEVLLGDENIELLCSLIAQNKSLTELSLKKCGISKNALSSLTDALKKNDTLVKLTLDEGSWRYPLEDVTCFIDVLKSENNSLQLLEMHIADADEFVRLIDQNANIKLVEFNDKICTRILENRKVFKHEARLALIRRMCNLDRVENNTLWLILEMAAL